MKFVAPFGVIVSLLVAVIALDDTPPRADLTFVNPNEVFTLDPQRMSWLQDFRLAYALYEGLVRWDNEDFSVEPAAATWSVSPDGLKYTFTIRPDARWSNGEPVTSRDFQYAWSRAILPDTAADYSNLFFTIAGAEAFFRWRSEKLAGFVDETRDLQSDQRAEAALALWTATQRRFAEMVALETPDDRTLLVTLERPTAYFLDLIAFGVFSPVHRPTVESFTRLNPQTARLEQKHGWTKPRHLVTNGPYVLKRWRYKRGLFLEVNPHYHSPQIIGSRTVACFSFDDINTAVLAFESGRLDWLSDVNAE